MKSTYLLLTVTAIFLAFNSFASSDGVKKLRDEYHKKMVKVAIPINEEYEAKLQSGLKNALKFNKQDEAGKGQRRSHRLRDPLEADVPAAARHRLGGKKDHRADRQTDEVEGGNQQARPGPFRRHRKSNHFRRAVGGSSWLGVRYRFRPSVRRDWSCHR